jgi:DNA-directed RNA polymerase subunit RPC12/RpoP
VAAAIDYGCANCGSELNPAKAPERREVPRRGGRNLPVCDDCAAKIDAQGTLASEGVEGYERARCAA